MLAFSLPGPEIVAPFLVFSIPIIAIVGGITAGIVKTISRHRIIEMAQRERIAMIERGLDPSKLPPLPTMGAVGLMGDVAADSLLSSKESAHRRSQGLMIGGLVTLAVGISLSVMLYYIADEPGVWAVGVIPGAIGIALLLSAFLVRPRNGS
jgi:hypothetical protein